MAQSYVTDTGATMIIPSAKASYTVQPSNSGLATSGVLMLVGEADAGPVYTAETDLEANAFGPDQLADVVAKYKSGPIVDAFRIAAVPANDPAILGSPSRMVLVKTNTSVKASTAIQKINSGGVYGTLYDKSYGSLGNHIYVEISSPQAEVVPTTGSFTFIPTVGAITAKVSESGVERTTHSTGLVMAANRTPTLVASDFDGLTNVATTAGSGAKRAIALTITTETLGIAAGSPTAHDIVLTYSGTFGVTPVAGDTLVIPITNTTLRGASQENAGAYVITSATSSVINATKLSDAGKGTPSPVVGAITHPVTVAPTAIGNVDDIIIYAPITISVDNSTVANGIGKSLEIAVFANASTDSLANACFQLGTTTPVTWLSTVAAPVVMTATERTCKVNASRASDAISEEITSGGQVAFRISYDDPTTATAATVTITDTALTTSINGAAGDNLSLTLADFPTIADLVAFIDATPRYSAAVGTAVLGNLSPEVLDNVTAAPMLAATVPTGSPTPVGALNCRIKCDAYKFFTAISEQSVLVQLGNPATQATSGLPEVTTTPLRLSGGSKGGTLSTTVASAINALEMVAGNFLVPCFSRDASADYALGLTDASSTYTISGIHAAAKSHVLAMSTLKKGKNRQAFLAIDTTFANAQQTAANIASFRCSMNFQGPKVLSSVGTVTTFGSWMSAALAAGMQAAAFYKAIFNKGINASGFVQAAGDFDDRNDTNVEDALLAGLMPARRDPTGFWKWASDQTTYGRDNNFVFNSIQAVYVADIICTTTAQRMERAFVGQSVADVSAAVALTYFETIMSDFMRLKLIASSDDAKKGFKNVSIRISGGAMIVSAEIKLAGAIYFIPISFLVSPVTQTATV